MALKHVQSTYEALGRDDPLYAVLSFDFARGNRWDPEAFFARGRTEIAAAMAQLQRLGATPARAAALDFGCGAGRLTQALCEHFDSATGVDISASMIEVAERFNRCGERCRYLVNTTADLCQMGDASFDFVYSNISLQHSPPAAIRAYIAEFFRVLRPQGIAMFQVPSGPRHAPGSLAAHWYDFSRGPLRRAWKRLRGKAPVEIHYLARSEVEELIAAAGACLLEVRQEGSAHRSRVSYMYVARPA